MQSGIAKISLVVIVAGVVLVLSGLGYLIFLGRNSGVRDAKPVEEVADTESADANLTAGQRQLRQQWQRNCQGSGAVALTHLPMDPEDFGPFVPYGLLAGAHVTPIDHVYFSPKSYNSPRDAYPVYAMGDGYIIEVQRRSIDVDTGATRAEEFRLTFQHTCTFFTYFDLVTILSDEVYEAFPDLKTRDSAVGHMKVAGGQQIGRIGGQTLDTAVYNLELTLKGFIHPELYDGEAWKIHTDEFTKYFSPPLQEIINSRNPRQAEPRDGKIDYDVDGKLIGNWFKEGTKGYIDESSPDRSYYWEEHLALVPDLYDPTMFWVSIGNWQGKAGQFAVKGNAPDPATVDVSRGLIKYELVQNNYFDANNRPWDNMSFTPSIRAEPSSREVLGVALFQLFQDRQLKAEFFPGKTAAQVAGFTDQAWMYYR